MSSYRNFVMDFPKRCEEVWKAAKKNAEEIDREVTLSLMVASSGFVIPYERLKNRKNLSGDDYKYPEVTEKLNELLQQKFVNSELFFENCWAMAEASLEGRKYINFGIIEDTDKMPPDVSVEIVLDTIKNAIVDGNIFVIDSSLRHEIEELAFVHKLEEDDCYRFVKVRPESFSSFLDEWFKFLSRNVKLLEINTNQIYGSGKCSQCGKKGIHADGICYTDNPE